MSRPNGRSGPGREGGVAAPPHPAERPAEPGRRREPVQRRSRQRRQDILDVTARLVDLTGPDQVTTTSIADELGISVGSIYAYFDDRSAIFDEIVARSIRAHEEATTAIRDRMGGGSWFDASFAVIDSLAEAYQSDPGFRTLWFSNYLSPGMIEAMRRTDELQAQRLLTRTTEAGFTLECASPLDAMRMYVGLIDKGLDLAFRDNPTGDRQMIEETKQVVQHYIGAYLRPDPDAAGRAR